MPGVSYCPIHGVKLRKSGVGYRDINYQIIPASYAVIHLGEPEPETGNVYSEKYIRLAKDIAWLLDNGFSLKDNDWVRHTFKAASGRDIGIHIPYGIAKGDTVRNRFANYLAGKILNESGRDRIESFISLQMGMILSIEERFGSIADFSEQ